MNNPVNEGQGVKVSHVLEVPGFYFNGFSIGVSPSDITMMLTTNNTPQAQLNMSYTTAKSLKDFLESALTHLEKATGQTLMTSEFIEEKINEQEKKKG